MYKWTEIEYSEYLDKRSKEEVGILFGNCLDGYAEDVRKRGEKEFALEYPILRELVKAMSK
jgi:hypothetical protein